MLLHVACRSLRRLSQKVRQGGSFTKGGKDNFYVDWVLTLELKLSKTLSGFVYVYCSYGGGLRPPYKYGTKYTSPLRVFDNFHSKAKIIGTFNFSKNKK